MEGFEDGIKRWDGKTVSDIEQIYSRYSSYSGFVSRVVDLLSDEALQTGASWLLKRYFEDNKGIDESAAEKIYRRTPALISWESKLHILQCIPHLPVSIIDKYTVERFLRVCLNDKNKFVRAWAFGGFYSLADQHDEYRKEARQLLASAMIDESASVRARIRNATKKGFMANDWP